jgi:hypothetical protein
MKSYILAGKNKEIKFVDGKSVISTGNFYTGKNAV